MKKLLFALVAVAMIAVVHADDLRIDGDFKQLNSDGSPALWYKNHAKNPAIGTGKIIPASERGENALQITADQKGTEYVSTKSFTCKPGNKVEFDAKIKGTGKCRLGIFVSDQAGFITSVYVIKATGNPERFSEVEGEHIIPAYYEKHGKQRTATSFRVFLLVEEKSSITFEDVEVELDTDK